MLAYFDCFSGISGDMTLGALISLGVPLKWLKQELRQLPLKDFELSVETIVRNGISARSVRVLVEDDTISRDHTQIQALLVNSSLNPRTKAKSLEIFDRLASAEADIHGIPKEKIHFHEVGGTDAIIDIVGTALCIEYLGIREIVASRIPLGQGFVKCKHGVLPVPAPATLAILRNVPVYGSDIPHELVTPTGAAIIVSLANSFGNIPDMMIEEIGYGAGIRDLDTRPNLLRVLKGKMNLPVSGPQAGRQEEMMGIVETCIDDMNPEFYGFLMERLFEDGALDVYLVPLTMKKNRPGTMIKVLCRRDQKDTIANRILSETTTLGVRYYDIQRITLAREKIRVDTSYGKIEVKRIQDPSGNFRNVPEYEVCKKIALEKNIPLKIVYDTVTREAADD